MSRVATLPSIFALTICALLSACAATAPTSAPRVSVFEEGHHLGDPDARIVLLEFSDYQCPFCRRFHDAVFPEIRRAYVDAGVLRYVSLDFPLREHRQAAGASIVARCAHEQGRYWEMRARLYANQTALGPALYPRLADELGLDRQRFLRCLDSPEVARAVQRSAAAGRRIGVNGTPTFILMRMGAEGTEVKFAISGVPSFELLSREIEKLR